MLSNLNQLTPLTLISVNDRDNEPPPGYSRNRSGIRLPTC